MKKKVILGIILVLLLIGAGSLYIYFETDLFKSEKQIFLDTLKNSDILKETSEDKAVKEYLQKQQNTPYTNDGEISLNMSGIEDEDLEALNNSKIIFDGKTDNTKKSAEQNITLKTGIGIDIPLKFKKNGEQYGIQTNLINDKYIVLKNENLKKLAERFEIDTEQIPDKIDINKSKFTEKEIKELKEKYYKILENDLEESYFKIEKQDKNKILKLEIPEEKFVNIISNILEEISKDEIILSKLPDGIDQQDFKDKITSTISEMKASINTSNKIDINVYVKSKKITKLEMMYLEEAEITSKIEIERTNNKDFDIKIYDGNEKICDISIKTETNENDVTYKITLNTKGTSSANIEFVAQFKNILTLDNVEENYNINMSSKIENEDEIDPGMTYTPAVLGDNVQIKINYKNTKKFEENISIEELDSNNSIIINDATDEDLQKIILNLYTNLGLI